MIKKLLYGSLVISIMTLSCTKEDQNASTGTTATTATTTTTSSPAEKKITILSSPVFRGWIEGLRYYLSTDNNLYTTTYYNDKRFNDQPGENPVREMVSSYTSAIYKTDNHDFSISIENGSLFFPEPSASDSLFYSFFQAGTVPFQSKDNKGGITIRLKKSDGKEWHSSYGEQSESSFTIDTIISGTNPAKFKASFNCKVYNETGDVFIPLSNCEYVGFFHND